MPEGVASGPGGFQQIMENTLRGIPNTQAYLDNIYCTGKTNTEHLHILYTIFKRLEEKGFKINMARCDFMKTQIEILGFTLDKEGLHKSEKK